MLKVCFSSSSTAQPWPALIEWLGEVSGMAIDWQELPGDFINLRTPAPLHTGRNPRSD